MSEEELADVEEMEEESEEELQTQDPGADQGDQAGGADRRRAAKPAKKGNQCLACHKNCTKAQYSVKCALCDLWCHKNCAGISEETFRHLNTQQKETGFAFWACKSCLSYSKKVNAQFKKVDRRMEQTEKKVEENEKKIKETDKKTVLRRK